MEWICRKAEIYGFDTDNVVIVGDSAGAQLASQYAVICTDPDYAKIMEITPPEFSLRAVGLNCGMYDLKERAGEIPGNKLMIDYFTKDPSVYGKKLDVLSHVTEKFPPAYLLSAKGDFPCGTVQTHGGTDPFKGRSLRVQDLRRREDRTCLPSGYAFRSCKEGQ